MTTQEIPLPALGSLSATGHDEVANVATHAAGLVLSIASVVLLTQKALSTGSILAATSVFAYGSSLLVLYAASTLYHFYTHLGGHVSRRYFAATLDNFYSHSGAPVRCRRWRVVDHCAIYGLIAGTYTPICLLGLGLRHGLPLLAFVWLIAALGVAVKIRTRGGCHSMCTASYLLAGWSIVGLSKTAAASLDPTVWQLIVLGGVVYTVGVVFYAWRQLPYHHALWHLFVLAGSCLHYLAILRLLS